MLTYLLACWSLFLDSCVEDSGYVSACPQDEAHIEVLVPEHISRVDMLHLLVLVLVMRLRVWVLSELWWSMI